MHSQPHGLREPQNTSYKMLQPFPEASLLLLLVLLLLLLLIFIQQVPSERRDPRLQLAPGGAAALAAEVAEAHWSDTFCCRQGLGE